MFHFNFEGEEFIMKSTKKKLMAVMTAVAVMGMSLVGCGAKLTPADQNISALYELSAKNNPAPMMELLGYETEEDVYNAFFEDGVAASEDTEIIEELKYEFESMGLEISEEELGEFSDAMSALFDKVTYTTEITSEEKDTIIVTVKVNGISEAELEQVMIDAATVMSENLEANLTEDDAYAIMAGDMSSVTPYMQQYLKDIIEGVKTLELVTDPYEFEVECQKLAVEVGDKEKVAWLPADMNDFEDEVERSLYQ